MFQLTRHLTRALHARKVLSSLDERMPVVTRKGSAPHQSNPSLAAVIYNLRQIPQEAHQPVSNKHAAVLVPLFEDAEGVVRVLLTQRSHKLSTHQGEVCLPGGKRDPSDPSDVFTALREAQEELGLDPSEVEVISQLPPLLSKHYLSVTPVVAKVAASFVPQPNPAEVAAVFHMPLSSFLDPAARLHSSKDLKWEGYSYRIHFFEHEGYTVWGLTAGILIQVAKHGFRQQPSYQEHTRKGEQYARFHYDGQRLTVHTSAVPPVMAVPQEQSLDGAASTPVDPETGSSNQIATSQQPAGLVLQQSSLVRAVEPLQQQQQQQEQQQQQQVQQQQQAGEDGLAAEGAALSRI